MASEMKFFTTNPITGTNGAWDDWELQTGGNPNISRSRSQSLKSNGDQLNAVQYDAKISYTETYDAKTVATTAQKTALEIPSCGSVSGGAHIDSVHVEYSRDAAPKMTLATHKHATVSGVASAHETCRTYTPTVVFPIRAIGVPSTLSDTSSNTIFTAPSGIGVSSVTYDLKVTHVDEQNGDGGHLASENRDGVETLTISFVGDVVTSELSIDSSWMLPDSDAVSEGNTTVTSKTITLTKHIACDVSSS